jgi:hypothetical protein
MTVIPMTVIPMTVILMTVLGGIHPGQALSASHLLSRRPHKLTPSPYAQPESFL